MQVSIFITIIITIIVLDVILGQLYVYEGRYLKIHGKLK